MVNPGEFGDREDIRVAALVTVLLIPIVGIFLLSDALLHESNYGHYSTTVAIIGVLLVVIGIILLVFTIRWVKKA